MEFEDFILVLLDKKSKKLIDEVAEKNGLTSSQYAFNSIQKNMEAVS